MVAAEGGIPDGGLTEYERKRLEQVRKNQEKLAALGIPALKSELEPAKKPEPVKPKGLSTRKRRLTEDVLPRRTSSRLAGQAAAGGEVLSERAGKVTVTHVERGGGASHEPSAPPQPKERHPKSDLPFSSSNGGPATDEAFIQLLAHAASAADNAAGSGSSSGGKGRGKGGKATLPTAAQLAELRLAQDDVAKVTKESIAHLAFHPSTDTLLLAAADKQGNVGLWHCDHGKYVLPASERQARILKPGQEQTAAGGEAAAAADGGQKLEAGDGDEGSFEGVLLTTPHYQYVSGLKWAGGPGRGARLLTVSYDGSARSLDVATGISELLLSTEDTEFSCADVTADGRTVLLGDNDGELCVLDTRQRAAVATGLAIASKKVNTLHIEPGAERFFVSASTDTAVRVWDLRKLGGGVVRDGGARGAAGAHGKKAPKPVESAAHGASCQGAFYALDGSQRIVSTSFDNTVCIWDSKGSLNSLARVKHNNNTGRYIMPFRAQWTPSSDGFVVGNMQRFVDVYNDKGHLLGQLGSEHMTAIPARACLHPALPVVAAATASGRVHLYR